MLTRWQLSPVHFPHGFPHLPHVPSLPAPPSPLPDPGPLHPTLRLSRQAVTFHTCTIRPDFGDDVDQPELGFYGPDGALVPSYPHLNGKVVVVVVRESFNVPRPRVHVTRYVYSRGSTDFNHVEVSLQCPSPFPLLVGRC